MLSVLPAAVEATPWAANSSRKRPVPPSCVGEYHSAASRAKRLRQELLRLREWEQRVYQERMGALEGRGDSSDESLTIEPAHPAQAVHTSAGGSIYFIEDVLETSSLPCVHESPRVEASDAPKAAGDHALTPLTLPKTRRQAASNPTNTQALVLVHTLRTTSLPNHFAFPSVSSAVPGGGGPASGTFPLICADVIVEEQEDEWSQESFNLSGSANPLEDFHQGGDSVAASVQQTKPHADADSGSYADAGEATCEAADVRASSGSDEGVEENLPREETSQDCQGGQGCQGCPGADGDTDGAKGGDRDASCMADSSDGLVLPPLPQQYLGMPMPQRLRLLEFFSQASTLLGLGTQSVYLASVLLDCCWVEEGRRRGGLAKASASASASALEGSELQAVALACLLHAYLCARGAAEGVTRSRLVKSFCCQLTSGAAQYPRVGAMLPAKASVLEQRLGALQALLPLAVAQETLSESAWVFGSMLELRGCCTQKEHLVVFVSQLCAIGYTNMPAGVLGSANCCLLTGAVCPGHANRGRGRCDTSEHHLEHFQMLQDFLCTPVPVQSNTHHHVHDCEEGDAEGDCHPEPSAELSV